MRKELICEKGAVPADGVLRVMRKDGELLTPYAEVREGEKPQGYILLAQSRMRIQKLTTSSVLKEDIRVALLGGSLTGLKQLMNAWDVAEKIDGHIVLEERFESEVSESLLSGDARAKTMENVKRAGSDPDAPELKGIYTDSEGNQTEELIFSFKTYDATGELKDDTRVHTNVDEIKKHRDRQKATSKASTEKLDD